MGHSGSHGRGLLALLMILVLTAGTAALPPSSPGSGLHPGLTGRVGLRHGASNGAVFKLVLHYFPAQTGTVTGLVGAAGGLGGFFPPLVLGIVRDLTGSYALGFIFLSVFALGCFGVVWRIFIHALVSGT